MALVLRFIDKLRRRSAESGYLTTSEEVNHTEKAIFKLIQEEVFQGNKEKVIAGLNIQEDSNGMLCVRTKLSNREDSQSFKSPILLPNSHPFVEMLIRETHVSNCHGGAQLLIGVLREKVWIINARKAVKSVLKACVTCERSTAKKVEVSFSALPEDRVKDVGAFQVMGIDLTGPLILKNKSKVWIVLFTCAVYRAVHLELVQSLSTEDFLFAFVRFCKRKRRPETVYSDNGTNFQGAKNLLKSIDWKEVEKRTRQRRIQWKFIPPAAPWWGGWWERLFRNIKDLLRRMMGFGKLNFVELETCLCEVEAAINNRPLTFVTEDDGDLIPLTPALFIYNLQETEIPEAKVLLVDSLGAKKKSLDKLMEELRGRFRKEYLGQLVQRGKEKPTRDLQVGDIVFVGRDDRILWPMGRILELIPGKDGISRVARVKTKTGELIRPLQRLYPLELTQGERENPVLVKTRDKTLTSREEVKAPEKLMKTRYGRVVKQPLRYGYYKVFNDV